MYLYAQVVENDEADAAGDLHGVLLLDVASLPPSGCADPLDSYSYTMFPQIYKPRVKENFREKSTDMHAGLATPADLVDPNQRRFDVVEGLLRVFRHTPLGRSVLDLEELRVTQWSLVDEQTGPPGDAGHA